MPLSVKRVKPAEYTCSACSNEHPDAGALFEVHIRGKNKIQKIYLCEADIAELFTLASNAKLSKGITEYSADYTDSMKERDGNAESIFMSKSDSTIVYSGKDDEYVCASNSGEFDEGDSEDWPDESESEESEDWGEVEVVAIEDESFEGWGEPESKLEQDAADDSESEEGWGDDDADTTDGPDDEWVDDDEQAAESPSEDSDDGWEDEAEDEGKNDEGEDEGEDWGL